MAITVIPPSRTGGQEFLEAFTPYLQQAFSYLLQRKMQEQQRQRNIEQAQQILPGLFQQPSYEELTRQRGMPTQGLQYPQALPPTEREAFYKDIYTRKFGEKVPSQFLKFAPEKAQQYPGFGINLQTGEMEYKVPTPDIFTQMAQWEAQKGKGVGTQPITLPSSTPEEAIQQKVIGEGGEIKDYTAKPIYSTGKGGLKIITGYEAELTPGAEAEAKARGQEKIKSESLVKQFSFIKEDFNTLKTSLSKIPAGRFAGPQAYLEALGGGEGSEYVFNYTRDRDLILSKIAKTFGGEVGVLTEGDIKRIRDAFPPLWMNQRERDFQIKWINDYIQRRIDAYSDGQPQTDLEYQKYLQAIGGQ